MLVFHFMRRIDSPAEARRVVYAHIESIDAKSFLVVPILPFKSEAYRALADEEQAAELDWKSGADISVLVPGEDLPTYSEFYRLLDEHIPPNARGEEDVVLIFFPDREDAFVWKLSESSSADSVFRQLKKIFQALSSTDPRKRLERLMLRYRIARLAGSDAVREIYAALIDVVTLRTGS
jgi:hypothetical protein